MPADELDPVERFVQTYLPAERQSLPEPEDPFGEQLVTTYCQEIAAQEAELLEAVAHTRFVG